jgi:hypothetical protein
MPKETEPARRVFDDEDVYEDFVDEDRSPKKLHHDFEDEGDEPDD